MGIILVYMLPEKRYDSDKFLIFILMPILCTYGSLQSAFNKLLLCISLGWQFNNREKLKKSVQHKKCFLYATIYAAYEWFSIFCFQLKIKMEIQFQIRVYERFLFICIRYLSILAA